MRGAERALRGVRSALLTDSAMWPETLIALGSRATASLHRCSSDSIPVLVIGRLSDLSMARRVMCTTHRVTCLLHHPDLIINNNFHHQVPDASYLCLRLQVIRTISNEMTACVRGMVGSRRGNGPAVGADSTRRLQTQQVRSLTNKIRRKEQRISSACEQRSDDQARGTAAAAARLARMTESISFSRWLGRSGSSSAPNRHELRSCEEEGSSGTVSAASPAHSVSEPLLCFVSRLVRALQLGG